MTAKTPVWIAVVVVVAVAGAGLGFWGGYAYRGSPAASPSAALNATLGVLGAGSLVPFFPELASELVNQSHGTISAPNATQTYEGSLDIINAIAEPPHTPTDVAAVADFRLIPADLEPTYASWEVVFGATPEVLAYDPALSAFDGIDSTNWGWMLPKAVAASGVPMGVWNASTDPNGYNEIFAMELQGEMYNDSANLTYGQFYNGPATGLAVPNPKMAIIEHESQAAELVSTGTISAVITYRSYALANHMTIVPLNPIVGLDANNTTALADYATLTTQVLTSSLTLTTVHAAPILFAVTVPSNAPNAALGAAFVHLLLSPAGQAILTQDGAFTPIFPGWSDNPSKVPSVLAPDVTTLPAWASGFLT